MNIYIHQLFFPQEPISDAKSRGEHKIKESIKRIVLAMAKFSIPSNATVEDRAVYEAYEPLWEQMLTGKQSSHSLIQNVFSIIAGAVLISKNYYIFGDFGGLCLRQRLMGLFRRGN